MALGKPTYVGISSVATGYSGSVQASLHPFTQRGDLMVAFLWTSGGNATPSESGWTLATSASSDIKSTNDCIVKIYYKAHENESAGPLFSGTTTLKSCVLTLRGTSLTSPIAGTATNSADPFVTSSFHVVENSELVTTADNVYCVAAAVSYDTDFSGDDDGWSSGTHGSGVTTWTSRPTSWYGSDLNYGVYLGSMETTGQDAGLLTQNLTDPATFAGCACCIQPGYNRRVHLS